MKTTKQFIKEAKEKETTLIQAYIEEQQFIDDFYKFKYESLIKIGGWTECFRPEIYDIMFNNNQDNDIV